VRSIPQDGSAPTAAAETGIHVAMSNAQVLQSVGDLIAYLHNLTIAADLKRDLTLPLAEAILDFKVHRNQEGLRNLDTFQQELRKHRNAFKQSAADAMQDEAEEIVGCVQP
jgi:hypothetical protein